MAETELTTRREGDVAVITAPNYINQDGGEQISTAATALMADGCNRLVLNLAGCALANSVGISFLIEVLEANKEAGGRLAFCSGTRTIAKTLQIMGLLQTATMHDTEEEAIATAAG
jgi:anti-anti-sigma factor